MLPAEARAVSIDIAPKLVILSVYFMTRNVIIEATKKNFSKVLDNSTSDCNPNILFKPLKGLSFENFGIIAFNVKFIPPVNVVLKIAIMNVSINIGDIYNNVLPNGIIKKIT